MRSLRKIAIAALFLCASLAFAEDAPQISPELRAKFWRANAEAIAAQVQVQRAEEKLKQLQAEMQKVCGKYQLVSGKDGEPVCSDLTKLSELPK